MAEPSVLAIPISSPCPHRDGAVVFCASAAETSRQGRERAYKTRSKHRSSPKVLVAHGARSRRAARRHKVQANDRAECGERQGPELTLELVPGLLDDVVLADDPVVLLPGDRLNASFGPHRRKASARELRGSKAARVVIANFVTGLTVETRDRCDRAFTAAETVPSARLCVGEAVAKPQAAVSLAFDGI